MKKVIALKAHQGQILVDGVKHRNLIFPKGCIGMALVFESKKSARDYWGDKINLLEIKEKKEC